MIVIADDLLFRVFRGCGDLRVWVAPRRLPGEWAKLHLVLSMIEETTVSQPLFLVDVARLLRDHMGRLKEAFSENSDRDLRRRLADVHELERAVIRQGETKTNRKLGQ